MVSPDQPAPEIAITTYDMRQHEMAVIAAIHLAVRLRQREDKENWILREADITNSQADLLAIDEYYVKPGGNFFVATDLSVNRIVGFVGIKRESPKAGELKRLAVIPEYRGHHIGLRLVAPAIDWSAEERIQRIHLVTDEKEYARELVYEPLGFNVVGFDEELRDYHMELFLPGAE